jgi:hypothetical protein
MAGFAADDGASLLMTFRGLQAEGARQGDVHKNISHELHTLVADPFAQWAEGHRVCSDSFNSVYPSQASLSLWNAPTDMTIGSGQSEQDSHVLSIYTDV